jgi:hypothetical protein
MRSLCVAFVAAVTSVASLSGLVRWDPTNCTGPFNPYFDPRWQGGVEFLGEYLHLRPCLRDLSYVIQDRRQLDAVTLNDGFSTDSLPQGPEETLQPESGHGFRIGYGRVPRNGCSDFTFSYARIWMRDRRVVISPSGRGANGQMLHGGLWATFGHPRYLNSRFNDNFVVSKIPSFYVPPSAAIGLRSRYNCFDAEAALRRIWGCNLWLRGYLAVRGAVFDLTEKAVYTGVCVIPPTQQADGTFIPSSQACQNQVHHVLHRARTWAVGPRLGFNMRYDIASGVGLGAHVGTSFLVGKRETTWEHHAAGSEFFTTLRPINLHDPSSKATPGVPTNAENLAQGAFFQTLDGHASADCSVIPEFDCRLGVNYITCSGERSFVFAEVGYEFTDYIGGLIRSTFNDTAGTKTNFSRTFALSGIYLSIRFRY